MSDTAMRALSFARLADDTSVASSTANNVQGPGRGSVQLEPRFARLEEDTTLDVPAGYYASILLKLVGHDDAYRYYAWWVMAGRNGQDKVAIVYNYTGEDTIRVDLPIGVPLTRAVLQQRLQEFLHGQSELEGKPPKIVPDDEGLIDGTG
jgi:hypothetical protein